MRWNAEKLSSNENIRNVFLEHISNLTALYIGLLVGAILKHLVL